MKDDAREKNRIVMLKRREVIQLATLGAAATLAPRLDAAPPLVVIVNSRVGDSPSRADLAAIFTTRKQSWGGGKRIVPFNFPAKHSSRVSFDHAVLSMGPDDVARYWIDRRIRGGNPPPKQVPNARLIVRLVERLDGAIGYVPSSEVTSAVRVVSEVG
jgi:hypothetical protein